MLSERRIPMSSERKLKWLKAILLVKVFFCFFVWGLPYLLAPMAYFQRLGIPMPDDSLFIKLSGAIIIAFGVAYWYAYKDPVQNVAIVKAGVVDNGLVTLVIFVFMAFYNLRSAVVLASGLLTLFFFISFLLLMPKPEVA
jgi:hypothetical protein